jgi:tRNA/tmRNA/rRNA uracil-C5-methylase (TrmA/RlmC/RlmD family)
LRWPMAQVTGIDISATSVRCTEELKRKYNLTNLQVHQLPTTRLSAPESSIISPTLTRDSALCAAC